MRFSTSSTCQHKHHKCMQYFQRIPAATTTTTTKVLIHFFSSSSSCARRGQFHFLNILCLCQSEVLVMAADSEKMKLWLDVFTIH